MNLYIFSKESRGGMETFINQLAFLRNTDFSIATFLFKKDKDVHLLDRPIYLNNLYPHTDQFKLIKIYLFFLCLLRTVKIARQTSRQTIFLSLELFSTILLLSIKTFLKKDLRVICMISSNFPHIIEHKSNKIYRWVLFKTASFLYKRADSIVCMSQNLKDASVDYFRLNPDKIVVIPYAVNLVKYKQKKQPKKQDKEFIIISVGRLDVQKDLQTLIKAFSIVSQKSRVACNLKLWIVGDGEEKASLIRLTKKLHVASKIIFYGWQRDVIQFLNKADLFVFSSHYEGFAMTIIEAMACGLPVIATNSPYGPEEILQKDRFGLLIPPRNVDFLVEAITSFISNKRKLARYKSLSLQRSHAYDMQTMLQKYKALFLSVG